VKERSFTKLYLGKPSRQARKETTMSQNRNNDEGFEVMKKAFEENNPELAGNLKKIREEIAQADADLKILLDEKSENFKVAISLLWQFRNFLAKYIGDEEVKPPVFEREEEEVNPLLLKHVAIYVDGGGTLKVAFRQVLNLCKDTIRIEFYDSIRDIIEAQLSGKLCGIIGIHLNKDADIQRHIRHDLKNMSEWNYEKAEAAMLPSCADFFPPHALGDILETISKMQKGEYLIKSEEFNLGMELSSLIGKMQIPCSETTIAIVDDRREEIEGMVKILQSWPRVNCIPVIQETSDLPNISPDIWLLDEDMPEPAKRGSEYARELRIARSQALIASTTGGQKPKTIDLHFSGKTSVTKSRSSAEDFIRFINKLLSTILDNDFNELVIRSQKALKHERAPELIKIAREISPSSVISLAEEMVDEETAKSCRFLAKIKRDYPEKFKEMVSQKC